MSGGDSSGEKTEQPTEKKKRDARQKGQVAQSKDFVSAVGIIATFLYFVAFWDDILAAVEQFFNSVTVVYEMKFDDALSAVSTNLVDLLNGIVGPFLALSVLAAIGPSFLIVGFLFTTENMTPKFEKLSPVQGVKKLFNMKNLIEFLKSVTKLCFLFAIVIIVYWFYLEDVLQTSLCGLICLEAVFRNSVWTMGLLTVVTFLLVGAFDLKLQQWIHIRSLKMTKDEVKREHKQTEGDPQIKNERKNIGQDMVMNGAKISEAAIVVFGGGSAVALKYIQGDTPLPQVIAKGKDDAARRVISSARKADVPLVSSGPLARDLCDAIQNGDYITEDFVNDVAKLLSQNKKPA